MREFWTMWFAEFELDTTSWLVFRSRRKLCSFLLCDVAAG
jgi:hypothetical protein